MSRSCSTWYRGTFQMVLIRCLHCICMKEIWILSWEYWILWRRRWPSMVRCCPMFHVTFVNYRCATSQPILLLRPSLLTTLRALCVESKLDRPSRRGWCQPASWTTDHACNVHRRSSSAGCWCWRRRLVSSVPSSVRYDGSRQHYLGRV